MPKSRNTPEPQAQEPDTVVPPDTVTWGAFESFIKDGPTQDDLNPAYAPPKEEAAPEADED